MVSALLDHLADVEDVTPVGRRVAQLRDRAVALVVQRPLLGAADEAAGCPV
ncbi:hypothetical protein [Streptomyces sp. NPDC047009]|uniref:hypothetical protein n=1 Tax=unclassified Streptomyces TaxID=2593676 RepID=UPI003411BC82